MSSIHELSETIIDGAPSEAEPGFDPNRPGPGIRVGRYLVLEGVGQGGMAAVFLAHDPELYRHVAIKVLRPRSGPRAAVDQARLLREAQALAQLSHPNLVQVHDVGTWNEQVFIAMEYVKGPSLQQWLETPRSWREVVQHLRAAGEGLAAAHEAGLVHRDFKPANVLVGDDGRVRVADFGLARLGTEPDEPSPDEVEDATATDEGQGLRTSMTESGVVMGTPAYMAPEQHKGERVDARSDQYAFCVTLYEGVFGRRPFEGAGRELLVQAKTEGPPTPSRVAEVPTWLRTIIMRGLAPDPAKRFESMSALLHELDAGLSRGRRRLGAAALLVALGTTAALGYASRSDAPDRCEESAIAEVWDEGTRRAIADSFSRVGVGYGDDVLEIVTRRLDEHASAWRRMRMEACEATHVRGEQSDELLDLRMECLRRRQGELEVTVEVLSDADPDVIDGAVELVATLPPVEICADFEALRATVPLPESPQQRAQVEALQDRVARLQAAIHIGHTAQAATDAVDVVRDARALGYAPLLAQALLAQALAIQPEDPAAAEALFRESLTTAARGHDDRRQVVVWKDLLFNVGQIQARHDEAISLAVGAEAALARLGDPPSLRADVEAALGAVEWRGGRFEQAVSHYERAQTLILDSRGSDDPRLRVITNNYGVVMTSRGRLEQAEAQFRSGLEYSRQAFGPQHPYVVDSLLNLGVVYAERGGGQAAQHWLEQALTVLRSVPNQNRRRLGQVLSNLQVATFQQGKLEQSRRYALEAREVLEQVHGAEHPSVAAPIDGLGIIALAEGDFAQAEQHLEDSVEILERTLGREHPNYAIASASLAVLRLEQGRVSEASEIATRAREILEASVEPSNHYYLSCLGTWAEAELAAGRAELAVEVLERAHQEAVEPFDRARFVFALARGLHALSRDPDRVRSLLVVAERRFADLGFEHWRRKVDRWADQVGIALP